MRLNCAFVSRILGSRVASEPLPEWVARHLSRCGRCRTEAEAYARLSQVLNANVIADEEPALTWHQLRATLPERDAQVARRAPAIAIAAAATVIAVAICFGFLLQNPKPERQTVAADRPVTRSFVKPEPEQTPEKPQVAKQPEQPAEQRQVVSHASRVQRPAPRIAEPRVEPAPRERLPLPDNPSTMAAAPEAPEAADPPEYTVVGAEEHVIHVVGVGPGDDAMDSDTGYVIQTTDSGDNGQVVLL